MLPGYGGTDACVLSFDNAGTYRWGKSFGSAAPEEAHSIRLRSDGEVIVAGSFFLTTVFDPADTTKNLNSVGGSDIFVASLSETGAFNWLSSIGGSGFEGSAVAVPTQEAGNPQVGLIFSFTDSFQTTIGGINSTLVSEGEQDIALIRYNALGEVIWALSYGGPSLESPIDMVSDSSGNLYQTGTFRDSMEVDNTGNSRLLRSEGESDIFVLRHSVSGQYLNATSAGGPHTDQPTQIGIKDKPSNASPRAWMYGYYDTRLDVADEINSSGEVQSIRTLTSAGFTDSYFAEYPLELNALLNVQQFGGTEADVGLQGYLIGADQTSLLMVGQSSGQIALADSSCDMNQSHSPQGFFDIWAQKKRIDNGNSTAIEVDRDLSVLLYPNPAQTHHIIDKLPIHITELTMMNGQGQIVMQRKVENSSPSSFSLNIEGLSSGIYLLRFSNGARTEFSSRFVKE